MRMLGLDREVKRKKKRIFLPNCGNFPKIGMEKGEKGKLKHFDK